MRSSHNTVYFDEVSPATMARVIQHEIKMDRLNLEANKTLGNIVQCLAIRHRIADSKLKLLLLSGDLPE